MCVCVYFTIVGYLGLQNKPSAAKEGLFHRFFKLHSGPLPPLPSLREKKNAK